MSECITGGPAWCAVFPRCREVGFDPGGDLTGGAALRAATARSAAGYEIGEPSFRDVVLELAQSRAWSLPLHPPIAMTALPLASSSCAADTAARTTAYAPATSSKVSSASGWSKRNISAVAGVSARAAPALKPAAGPEPAADRGAEQPDRGDPFQRLGDEQAP